MRFLTLFSAACLIVFAAACSQSPTLPDSSPLQAESPAGQRAHATSYRIVYAFRGYGDSDGSAPVTSLLDRGDELYGTTTAGGSVKLNNQGTVFAVTTAGVERVAYSFDTTGGAKPFGGLVAYNDSLYGTTTAGGDAGNGTIFEIDASDKERVFHNFKGGDDGMTPIGAPLELDGQLYGTTNAGGSGNNGTVYELDVAGGAESILHAFAGGNDGSMPRWSVVERNGLLYGITLQGGKKSAGTVFEVNPSTGSERLVYTFAAAPDASNPSADLTELDGVFYGVSQGGGSTGFGTVFAVHPDGTERVVYSFKGGADGYAPQAGLAQMGGFLYGTTSSGGARNSGTVFEVSPTGVERVLYSFLGGRDGNAPSGTLLVKDGRLYGVTRYGGGSTKCTLGCGTVFEISP
jgi:uncharacterized repeat protein (TIGR03803 family)